MDDQIISLLQQILETLKASQQPQELGFHAAMRRSYLYANRQYPPHLWYFWDGPQNKPIGVEHTALTCIVEDIQIEEKEFRGRPEVKLNLYVRAERPYVVQAGLLTETGKSLLASLSRVKSFGSPITIEVEPGETEQVLFMRVWCNGERMDGSSKDISDWTGLVETIRQRINPQGASQQSIPVTESNGNADLGLSPITLSSPIGAIDEFKMAIQDAKSLMDCQAARRKLESRKAEWSEIPGVLGVISKIYSAACARFETPLMAEIKREVERVGWTKAQAKEYLFNRWSKQTRAELNAAEASEFLAYLKSLPEPEAVF